MRWPIRLASGVLGVLMVATAFVTFFHLVPSGWDPPSDEPITVTETVRHRTDDGWADGHRQTTMMLRNTGNGYVASLERAGTIGPNEAQVRTPVAKNLTVQAAGAANALWSFPVRGPFEDRPGAVDLAVVRMDEGLPLVVAVDRFRFMGTATVADTPVEHWTAAPPPHRFFDDGHRYERVVERHVYVEPISGLVVGWAEHEQLWTHWQARLGQDPVDAILHGAVTDNGYLPIWDAWTNTTTAAEESLAERADELRTDRLRSMVLWAAPALLAGEMGLWFGIRRSGP